jgi:hypothetical protein
MKKFLSIVLFLFWGTSLFCQTASDYFPAREGYRWEYVGRNGQVTDTYQCLLVTKENDNQILVGVYQESTFNMPGKGTKVMYRVVEDTGVAETTRPDGNGGLVVRDKFIITLFIHERNWQEDDRGDVFQCHSKKTSVNFDGKTYRDCIVVEKAITLADGRPLMVKRQYFARGIGLVYVTLQDAGDSTEKPFLRLSSHNF